MADTTTATTTTTTPSPPPPPLSTTAAAAATAPHKAGATTRTLAGVLDYWRGVEWDAVRDVDAVESEVGDKAERALRARKQLAEATKEFKKKHAEAAAAAELPKLYQAEIDALTKRAKWSETRLVETLKAFADAPDPVPQLEELADAQTEVAKLKFENTKLAKDVAEFEREFSNLKNQDITIRRLEDRIVELEDGMDARVEQMVEARLGEAERERQDIDEDVAAEMAELREAAVRAERDATEQRQAAEMVRAELYEVRALGEEREASRNAEMEALQEELLSAKLALQEAQAASTTRSDAPPASVVDKRTQALEEEMKRREEELARAYLALDAARGEATRAREAEAEAIKRKDKEMEDARAKAEERLSRERERAQELAGKLEHAERLLESKAKDDDAGLVGSGGGGAGSGGGSGSSGAASSGAAEAAQEALVKSLESTVASTRVALAERDAELSALRVKHAELEERTGDLQDLVRKMQLAEFAAVEKASSEAMPLSQPGTSTSQVSDMMSIVQEQRDRFRRRMLELEDELERKTEDAARAWETVEALRLEKQRGGGSSAGSSSSSMPAMRPVVASSSMLLAGGGPRRADSIAAAGPWGYAFRFLQVNSVARSLFLVYIAALHLSVLASTHGTVQASCGGEETAQVVALRGSDPGRPPSSG